MFGLSGAAARSLLQQQISPSVSVSSLKKKTLPDHSAPVSPLAPLSCLRNTPTGLNLLSDNSSITETPPTPDRQKNRTQEDKQHDFITAFGCVFLSSYWCVFCFLPADGECKQAVTQTDRVRQGGKVKIERSLAPDQDRRHNVPSSSQPPNKAVPRRAPVAALNWRARAPGEIQRGL